MSTELPGVMMDDELARAVRRRRTFAIISHPDAGKTTLTEKLLLYGGAIHLAGAVKARRAQRHATSDWMKLEQERGISVTSSVMQFEFLGYQINLLDTPGHEDFSEDTYRTLVAADSAVMLLDNRRGVEERTRQLFEVCKRRRTPIFTFVNKCDRIGEDPLKLISDVEADLGIDCHPITWPVFRDDVFSGVYDRRLREVHLFERDREHGAREATVRVASIDDARLGELLGEQAHAQLVHDIQLLDTAGHPFSAEAVDAGTLTPVFFGSALTNFGVEPFLREFLELAPPPRARESTAGPIEPTHPHFSGFVFKIQANMDPKHRDRIAFVRVCSGKFEAGMDVKHVRSGKMIRLAHPQQFLARERSGIEEAWPGDVVGVMDRGTLRIGDTLAENGDFEFAGIPRFAPEHFARVIPADPLRRKQFDTGLRELTEEGAAQVFYGETGGAPFPIVGTVGMLQFDVMQSRLEHEYGAPCRFERMTYRFPRWVTGPKDEVERVVAGRGRMRLYDTKGNTLILFEDEWHLRRALQHETGVTFHDVAP
ncbi:MAG TPA: peptide chain release factor 3 [Gemmatimonadaceae bacterium]|nr:peptide chain release factor 3 [Gemmatimonadaceae bacterium]